jgi:DNA-binding MarR family transcriptional regulator
LTKLERSGFVQRDPSPDDRRKTPASLTAEGPQAKLTLTRVERRQSASRRSATRS